MCAFRKQKDDGNAGVHEYIVGATGLGCCPEGDGRVDTRAVAAVAAAQRKPTLHVFDGVVAAVTRRTFDRDVAVRTDTQDQQRLLACKRQEQCDEERHRVMQTTRHAAAGVAEAIHFDNRRASARR